MGIPLKEIFNQPNTFATSSAVIQRLSRKHSIVYVVLECMSVIGVIKWTFPCKELINQTSERPQVYRLSEVRRFRVVQEIPIFWCHVLRRAASGEGRRDGVTNSLGEPKVADLDFPCRSLANNEDVLSEVTSQRGMRYESWITYLRFDISMDDTLAMHTMKSSSKLYRYCPDIVFVPNEVFVSR